MTNGRAANAFDIELGARVRLRRLQIGMSQERLADLIGITFQQVQKYEKGVNRIAASRLFDMATALGMPISSFFAGLSGAGAEGGDRTIALTLATANGVEVIKLFAAIKSSKVRHRVLELVHAMTNEK